ncbi:DUF2254 domain-containing protein, partial [bacterium]
SSYWFVPAIMAGSAVILSFVMARVDAEFGAKFVRNLGWIYTGGPDGARSVLGAIAGSVIGVAGTTFSILIAVLSLTSGQFGPRLLRSFMRDTGNQIVLGMFTSTFLYCLLVLRTIRGTEETTYVPHFSVTLGVVLAILCVGVLIYFVHHVAESIQVSHLIDEIGKDADEAVERLFPEALGEPEGESRISGGDPMPVCAGPIGYVESIDEDALLKIACEHNLFVRVEVRPGEYVLPNMRLLSVWPDARGQEEPLRGAFSVGRWRTTLQDAEFAFLQLTEIAVRALSPGINDPFTAMQCLDRITASMCHVAARRWPHGGRRDDSGAVRIMAKPYEAKDLVQAAYGHIRHAAKDSPAVLVKLESSLETIIARAEEPGLRAALEAERRRI